jgi:hypothetical protein
MDEVFGYFPPSANPPSKTPMLTLLKQARAYGVGVVLATQNPVDLDYKGLANAGTGFLGRLQTERDKLRVLEGLEGASASAGAGFDRGRMEQILAGLKSRVFLMHNVHEDAPVLLHTRWAMSYLRGPLTRVQIQQLAGPQRPAAPPAARPRRPGPRRSQRRLRRWPADRGPPSRPRRASHSSFPPARPPSGAGCSTARRSWASRTCTSCRQRTAWTSGRRPGYLAELDADVGAAPWDGTTRRDTVATSEARAATAEFATPPVRAADPKSYKTWEGAFKTYLYKDASLSLLLCPALKLTSRSGETRPEFMIRVREAVRAQRDGGVERLRRQYAPKLGGLQERIRKAEGRVGRERSEYDPAQAADGRLTRLHGAGSAARQKGREHEHDRTRDHDGARRGPRRAPEG